jgi:CheY-like chemotaxis protein
MLGSSLRDNIELVYDCSPDAWPVRIDGAEFDLALVNMAVNARDAMQGSGRVNVSVRNVNVKPSAELGGLSGDFVTVAMSDTGTGIAPNHLSRIFEPFFTTKPLDKGTGLGLSQVYGFARQSGGHVTVSSEPGEGTTITLYLPRSHETVAARTDAVATPAAAHGHGVVLVVEDNREVAETATSLLEQLGYQVARAETASEALSRLARGEKFSLVFSDIVMSGDMDGIALAREVRLRYPAVPILLTSGYSHEAQSVSVETPILRKPYQIGALDRAIREVLSAGSTELGMVAEA